MLSSRSAWLIVKIDAFRKDYSRWGPVVTERQGHYLAISSTRPALLVRTICQEPARWGHPRSRESLGAENRDSGRSLTVFLVAIMDYT
jgi:hypothetical protein